MPKERLDTRQIKTVEQLNAVNFSKYENRVDKGHVEYVQDPISSAELSRICELSTDQGSKVTLSWNMAELFFKMKTSLGMGELHHPPPDSTVPTTEFHLSYEICRPGSTKEDARCLGEAMTMARKGAKKLCKPGEHVRLIAVSFGTVTEVF